ncbi:hypothetical protein EBR03_00840 [bacterium]|nr:hypothetical protein [bacterium]
MMNRLEYYIRFFIRTLSEDGLYPTVLRFSDFLKRRRLGFGLLAEWFDYQVSSRFRSPQDSLITLLDPNQTLKTSAPWTLYSSFDKGSVISEDVLSQLSVLKKAGFNVMFISSSPELGPNSIIQLSPLCEVIVHRQNIGHDFGSWKTGYELIKPWFDRRRPILLMNDSCFGPYSSMNSVFALLNNNRDSVVGVSKNYLIEEHLQSYFVGFGAGVVEEGIFDLYMNRIRLLKTKEAIVRFFEIGGSHFLRKLKVPLKALIDPISDPVSEIMKTWKSDNALKDPVGRELVERGLMPFYKRSNGAPLDLPLFSA